MNMVEHMRRMALSNESATARGNTLSPHIINCILIVLLAGCGQTALPADLLATNGVAVRPEAGIMDRRAEVAQATKWYRARYFPDGKMPPKHDFSQRPPVANSNGMGASARPKGTTEPTPGGVGYGIWFDGGTLEWSNSTVVDFYPITPGNLGQDVSTLYLTSTCRAQKGTESLIAYTGTSFPGFWIYDWSQPNDPWQVMIQVQTNYLTRRLDESGIWRQMAHIRNGTYYLGQTNNQCQFENLVMLFDFYRNGWDLMYATNYLLPSVTNNYYDPSSYYGSWGPIVETFESYTNVVPVGFDLCRLFQDGNANWLVANDTHVSENQPESGLSTSTNWQVLAVAPNDSFAVTITNGNVGSTQQTNFGALCVTANASSGSFSLNTNVGAASTGWVMTPGSNTWDLVYAGIPPGDYTVQFAPVPGFQTPTPQQIVVTANNITSIQAVYLPPLGIITLKPVSGGAVQLSWPAGGVVWRLLAQINHLATGPSSITNDWSTVNISAGTNQVSLPINKAQPAEYYRLVYP